MGKRWSTSYRIEGVAVGRIWLPPVEGFKQVSMRFSRESRNFYHQIDTLRDMLERLDIEEGGDFQSCKYDGVLIIEHHTDNRKNERWFDLRNFPSIKDYITEEPFSYPEDWYA